MDLGAPQAMYDEPLHSHALIVLALPVASKNMHKALQNMPRIQANLPKLISTFCSVFRENSKHLRAQFFQNDLIQLMWSQYINDESEYVAKYLA